MARNTRPRTAPAKLTDRFIDGTLDRLFHIEAELRSVSKKLDALLFEARTEAQIREVRQQVVRVSHAASMETAYCRPPA